MIQNRTILKAKSEKNIGEFTKKASAGGNNV
jgi:hypothetical protein